MSYELQGVGRAGGGMGSYELQGMGGLGAVAASSASRVLPAIAPGKLPGSEELRTRGTLNGVVPRGYPRNPAQVVAIWSCVNQMLPGGAPAQTSGERSAFLSSAKALCTSQVTSAAPMASTVDPSLIPPQDAGGGDNTMLYVGLGVAAVALLGGAYYLMK